MNFQNIYYIIFCAKENEKIEKLVIEDRKNKVNICNQILKLIYENFNSSIFLYLILKAAYKNIRIEGTLNFMENDIGNKFFHLASI